ncbi:TIGR02450 family Trp-rich protein [Bradymonas sediminis]|uniref:TIGR02450 family Trp-rich protein n=1 Tax=Bradymonas sediminis TaxID=1548548 RepID=A0A2Z4FQC9_9DELT|nr:TIGR02450 family Trp-rich protein [Bradymonas sediminis]AWV90844.1 TIGR02450 family Trp-rich protein [Bradymonas sediminis]TDP75420.1 tryptophan-rich hypothetical protein [Bradymonas sediminis]
MSIQAPHNPKKLMGTQWTAVNVENRRRHWEVIELHLTTDEVLLRAVIDGHTLRVEWRALRNREDWEPGWKK